MPFTSQKQRELFWARAKNSPKWKKMAEEYEAHTPSELPEVKHAYEGLTPQDIDPEGQEPSAWDQILAPDKTVVPQIKKELVKQLAPVVTGGMSTILPQAVEGYKALTDPFGNEAASEEMQSIPNPSAPGNEGWTPQDQAKYEASTQQTSQAQAGVGGAPSGLPSDEDLLGYYAKAAAEQKAVEDHIANTAMEKAQALTLNDQNYMQQQQKASQDQQEYLKASQARSDDLYNKMLNTQIDPQHYMHSKSTFGQCMSSIGLMFGAYGSGLTGGPNLALEQLNKNIDRDIDAQKANLGKIHTLYSMNLAKTHSDMEAMQMTKQDMLAMYKGQIQLTADQFGGPEAQNTAAMHKSGIDMQMAQIRQKLADDKLNRQLKLAQIAHANAATAITSRQLQMMTQNPQATALSEQLNQDDRAYNNAVQAMKHESWAHVIPGAAHLSTSVSSSQDAANQLVLNYEDAAKTAGVPGIQKQVNDLRNKLTGSYDYATQHDAATSALQQMKEWRHQAARGSFVKSKGATPGRLEELEEE